MLTARANTRLPLSPNLILRMDDGLLFCCRKLLRFEWRVRIWVLHRHATTAATFSVGIFFRLELLYSLRTTRPTGRLFLNYSKYTYISYTCFPLLSLATRIRVSSHTHLVESSNLPYELIKCFFYINSCFCWCFNESAIESSCQFLSLCATGERKNQHDSSIEVEFHIERERERERESDAPALDTWRSDSRSDLFATTITGKWSLSFTLNICCWNWMLWVYDDTSGEVSHNPTSNNGNSCLHFVKAAPACDAINE